MAVIVWVGCGGFLGAILRYAGAQLTVRLFGATWPTATLAVNVAGCFVMGILMTLMIEGQRLGDPARTFWIVGLLGSFTTFSAFGWETLAFLREGEAWRAILHVGLHLLLGIAMVALGMGAARLALM